MTLRTAVLIPIAVLALTAAPAVGLAQTPAPAIGPVTLGSSMPNFTLPIYQGGSVTFSSLRGKTIVLIFPRGYAAPGSWCHVCNYQYSEWVDYEAREGFRKKSNAEVIFVQPYAKEVLDDWVDKYPQQLADLEAQKNPPDPTKLDEAGRARMERARRVYPKSFKATRGQVPLPFPVLVDADRVLCKGLGYFTMEWNGSKVEQNIPTVLVIDRQGVVRFKYSSQNTVDRPGAEYLAKIVAWVNATF